MKKFLMLATLAGSLAGMGGVASAAPVAGAAVLSGPALVAATGSAQVETVQYGRCGPRCRAEIRRREWRRHHRPYRHY